MALIRDTYKRNRGGRSRMLAITCGTCDVLVCNYQKDGPGNLRRMYVDRISDSLTSTTGKEYRCTNGHIVGMRIIYEKENRPAFRVFVDSIHKKLLKS